MSVIADLRLAVYLRRIARAMELQASALDELRQIERDRWAKEAKIPHGPIKKTEISTFDVKEANERWQKEQEAAAVGATLEDVS